MKLTKSSVETAALPSGGKSKVLYWDSGKGAVTGFGVSVTANGVRTYVAQARVNGKNRRVSIGRHGVWTCDEAREHARALLVDMSKGIDPAEERRKAAASSETLREVMEEYLLHHRTSHGKRLRPSSQANIRRHVEQNLADIADDPIASITRNTCLERFNDLTERGLTGQANQCMTTVRSLCNFAREKHATPDGNYTILAVNPVSMAFGKHKLGKMHRIDPRDTRIPAESIGAVWSMLQQRRLDARTVDDRASADYVCMILLTGMRATETARLKWENVNLEEGWFRIIEDDAKNHNEIKLPISSALLSILKERRDAEPECDQVVRRRADQEAREASPYVFATWSALGHLTEAKGTMAAVSKVAGVKLGRHDLRRTFEDVASICGISDDKRRQLLNHLASDVHGRHYANNPDPKLLAFAVERVAQWIVAQAETTAPNNVVSMPARAA